MRIKSLLLVAATCAAGLMANGAYASLTIVSSVGGLPVAGANYVNFNDIPSGSNNGTFTTANLWSSADLAGTVDVTFRPDASAVTGNSSSAAPPVLSGGNGALFGPDILSPQLNGVDTTVYLGSGRVVNATPNASVTLDFGLGSNQRYLGLLWGSVDTFNTLEFFNGAQSLGTVTGTQVTPLATGNQGVLGTFYVNIDSSQPFDRVVITSSNNYAFEVDNVAYSTTAVIPEATTIAVWSGLSLLGWVAYRRRS